MTDLKPCPDCSATRHWFEYVTLGNSVMCDACGSRGPIAVTKAEAAAAWNALPRDTDRPTDDDMANKYQRDAAYWREHCEALAAALEVLFKSYKELADSGDAGFWTLEEQPEGQMARAALAAYRSAKP